MKTLNPASALARQRTPRLHRPAYDGRTKTKVISPEALTDRRAWLKRLAAMLAALNSAKQ